MAAGAWDFTDAVAGASWTRSLTWRVRNADGTPGPVYDLTRAVRGIFRVVQGDVVEEGVVVLGGITGVITFTLTDEQTFRLLGRSRYSLAVVYGIDDVRPVLNGRFTVNRSALIPTTGV